MGHEASGDIVEVGSQVTGWKQGDRVAFDSTVYCGNCPYCREGFVNLCDNRRVLGVSCEDYRRHGAFAEYVAIPNRILYRLPHSLSYEHAAMIEALSIAFHAVHRTPVFLGDTVVVIGCGMIGLLVIQSLRIAGVGKIIAVDVAQDKLDLAQKLGADHIVNSAKNNPVDAIKELTEGQGARAVFEAVGIPASVDSAIRSARKGGSVTLVGNITASVPFPLQVVVTRELTIYGSCASRGEIPACIDMLNRKAINVDCLISAVASLSDGAQWFGRLYQREAGLTKVILQP
jgi:threonine dehydrogenase-like Zn-dependent dehydrogenase